MSDRSLDQIETSKERDLFASGTLKMTSPVFFGKKTSEQSLDLNHLDYDKYDDHDERDRNVSVLIVFKHIVSSEHHKMHSTQNRRKWPLLFTPQNYEITAELAFDLERWFKVNKTQVLKINHYVLKMKCILITVP